MSENNEIILEELIEQFVEQTEDDIDLLTNQTIALKDAPYNEQIIAEMFRLLHSLKGHSSLLGFFNLKSLAHTVEDWIGDIRMDKKSISEKKVNILLSAFDLIRDSIEIIRSLGGEDDSLAQRYAEVMAILGKQHDVRQNIE